MVEGAVPKELAGCKGLRVLNLGGTKVDHIDASSLISYDLTFVVVHDQHLLWLSHPRDK